MSGNDYRTRVCTIDDCGADLYITHTVSSAIYNTDTAEEIEGNRVRPTTSHWSVGCSEGHVVVLPHDHAQDYATFGVCESCTEDSGKADPHNDLGRVHAMSRIGEAP